MKLWKIIFWIGSGLLSGLMLFSASMYLFNNAEVAKEFEGLGFPVWIIYPLAIAKILGVATILLRKSKVLTEWAYAGFLFNFLLAFGAHMAIGDGKWTGAVMALTFWSISYFARFKMCQLSCETK